MINILSLSNSHSNVASIHKNRRDKSHRVIVALDNVWTEYDNIVPFIDHKSTLV